MSADIQCDVCVIGGGITGLTTAYLLAKSGRSVVVLESGKIGAGETQRTTAHLSNALDDKYVELEKMHGTENIKLLQESHTAAISEIEKIIKDENIDCDFSRVDGYLMSLEDGGDEELKRELEAAQRAGLKDVQLLAHLPFSNGIKAHCLKFPNQGQFHVLKYLNGIINALEQMGAQLHSGSHVISIEDGKPLEVCLEDDVRVYANDVVVATNSPISESLIIHPKQAAYRSYVIGAVTENDSIPQALYWDLADPYHYIRHQKLDDGRTILIIGGEDHKTGQAHDSADRFHRLETWARRWFPGLGTVEFKWSGQVFEPVDGVAFIGKDPGFSGNVYLSTGDSGMGMTHGTIAGILLSALMRGEKHPWAEIYDPSRKSITSLGEFVQENLNAALQYGALLHPSSVKHEDDLVAGQSGIINKGLKKIAAYRDEEGILHHRSAFCTHLKGVVCWNECEKSWDCPVHGSRFGVDGEVLTAPAINSLEKVDE